MNQNQRTILIVAGAAIALMLFFPPHQAQNISTGYYFILSNEAFGGVNVAQLLAQWLGVCLLAGIAWLLAR